MRFVFGMKIFRGKFALKAVRVSRTPHFGEGMLQKLSERSCGTRNSSSTKIRQLDLERSEQICKYPAASSYVHLRNFINLPEVSGPSKRVDLIDFRLKKLQDSIRLETARFKLAKGDRRPK